MHLLLNKKENVVVIVLKDCYTFGVLFSVFWVGLLGDL